MKHIWKFNHSMQWSGGGGHVSTEVCTQCGRIARTSTNYRSTSPARRGNHNSDQHIINKNGDMIFGVDGELVLIDIDAEDCSKKQKWIQEIG